METSEEFERDMEEFEKVLAKHYAVSDMDRLMQWIDEENSKREMTPERINNMAEYFINKSRRDNRAYYVFFNGKEFMTATDENYREREKEYKNKGFWLLAIFDKGNKVL